MTSMRSVGTILRSSAPVEPVSYCAFIGASGCALLYAITPLCMSSWNILTFGTV